MTDTLNPLVGRYLTQYQVITAAGQSPGQVFTDILLRYCHAKKLNAMTLQKGTEVITPSAAMLEGGRQPHQTTSQLSSLLLAAVQQQCLTLDQQCALFITAPQPIEGSIAQLLELNLAGQVWQCQNEQTTFEAMRQAAKQYSELTHWVWLALDSRCTVNWLMQQDTLFSDPFPNGPIPGEALVVTQWQQQPANSAPQLSALAMAEEPAHGNQIYQKVETRAHLLRQVDENLTEQAPLWCSIMTNDDLSPEMAAEIYKTEADLWPTYQPEPLKGESSPFISSYPALGDLGLAALPLNLVMTAQRLQHPIKPCKTAYSVFTSGRLRLVGRMDTVSSDAPNKLA